MGRAKAIGPHGKLLRRAEFLAVAAGSFCGSSTVGAQFRARDDRSGARIGLTASRKVGGAVVRNRARRRLREAVRATAGPLWRPDGDYVLIARPDTAHCAYDRLLADVERCVREAPLRKARGRRRGGVR